MNLSTYAKRAKKYFGLHPAFNASVHALGGMGVGILIASPVLGDHPVRWGIGFMVISILGHLFAASQKK